MAMHCVPVPLASSSVKERRACLRALLKYHSQDRVARPAVFKHVALDLLVLVRKHRKSQVGPTMVYVAAGRELEYQVRIFLIYSSQSQRLIMSAERISWWLMLECG